MAGVVDSNGNGNAPAGTRDSGPPYQAGTATVDNQLDNDSNVDDATDDSEISSSGETTDEILEDGIAGTSPAQTIFNIVKNIVGEGMLSLPAGVAAGTGLMVAIMITAVFGVLLGYTFSAMGRVCHATHTKNHKEACQVVSGSNLAQFMAVVLMLKTSFTCVSYAMVIGESYSAVLRGFGLTGFFTYHYTVLIIIMLVILLPLCLQRDLSVLSYTSIVGVACEIFVVTFMQFRLADGSYAPEGKYYEIIPEPKRVSWGDADGPDLFGFSVTTFVLLSSLATAFIAHYNAPKFYVQMRRRSPRRFNRAIIVAFGIAFAIYVWVMTVGYLTFGKHCDGLILNNYSERDPWASAARVAIGIAVLFGFPLSFTALRDSFMSVAGIPAEKKRFFFPVTITLLAIITVLGCLLHDLGLVNSLGGAIFGALITLIFPGYLLYRASRLQAKGSKYILGGIFPKAEQSVTIAVICAGVVLLCFGSSIVLLKKFSPDVLGLKPKPHH
mmetsp:Transcript_44182/g.116922  ORF Transcript_44182/g.116922 Transcript_44182/m.116922 type:complete len:497 (+) Transcript_44182:125-1615(+)